MAYFGYPRGRKKASSTLRFLHNGDGTADLYTDGASSGSVTVGSGSWVQLVASLATTVNGLEIFDSTGNTWLLGTGASGSEVVYSQVAPGGFPLQAIHLEAGSRISMEFTVQASAGTETFINFWD